MEYLQDGSLINEIKIAEIVQMTCEEAEENNFVLLCQEGEVRADVVEVECQLDDEVAQLTGGGPGDDADLPDLDTFQVGSWVSDLTPPVTSAPSILYTQHHINNNIVYHPADPAMRGGDWTCPPQQKILFNKSATFPRQSQKCDETEPSESGLYYQGKAGPDLIITVTSNLYSSVGGGDLMLQDSYHHHQYNYIQNFHAYRGGKL